MSLRPAAMVADEMLCEEVVDRVTAKKTIIINFVYKKGKFLPSLLIKDN